VPRKRRSVDGEIIKRVLSTDSESDKYREQSDEEQQRNVAKTVFTHAADEEGKKAQAESSGKGVSF
jgi:hypothetical protein